MNTSGHNKNSYFKKLFSTLNSRAEAHTIVVLGITTLILATVATTLKVATPLLFLVALYLSKRYKNLFVGFFLIAIYSFQFFSPHKYYSVVALEGYEIENILFKEGRIITYGVNLSNIFLAFSLACMTSELVKRKSRDFAKYLRGSLLKHVLFALLYLVFGIGTAFLYSPYFTLSAIWTLQNWQVFLVAILVFYLYIAHRDKFNLIFVLIAFSLILQLILSSLQFLNQSSLGLSIEAGPGRQIYYALDEIRSFFRVQGTLLVHNELAYIIIIFSAIIIPKMVQERKVLYLSSFIAGFATLVMTQSRTNWIAFIILIFIASKFFSKEITKMLNNRVFKRGVFYFGLILAALSFIVIPRIILSFNAPLDNAGLSLREKMITEGFQAFIVNPLMGYGAGTNEVVLHSLFPDGVMQLFPYPVHQGHLNFLLEYGIISTTFFALPFYLTARRIINLVIKNKIFFVKHKNLIFTFFAGIISINLYYSFQNHFGIVEFPFVGLILGLGMIAAYSET